MNSLTTRHKYTQMAFPVSSQLVCRLEPGSEPGIKSVGVPRTDEHTRYFYQLALFIMIYFSLLFLYFCGLRYSVFLTKLASHAFQSAKSEIRVPMPYASLLHVLRYKLQPALQRMQVDQQPRTQQYTLHYCLSVSVLFCNCSQHTI